MQGRQCGCGSTSLRRVWPTFWPPDVEDEFWGCAPTGMFVCELCGRRSKQKLIDGEQSDRDYVLGLKEKG